MENEENTLSCGELIVLQPRKFARRVTQPVKAGIIVQLLSIHDNHPQWRRLNREDGIIAAHKYAAQLKDFSTQHEITKL